ncbi:MAG: hypothetical protein JWM35_2466 [Verrucomicrobia bacterium]|nr:hypothetical protein [Verrucomicrobiota bacterium]
MKKEDLKTLPGIICISALLSACSHQPALLPTGEGAFTFVAPQSAPGNDAASSRGPKIGTDFAIAPEPILPLATPVYPPAALAAHRGLAIVGVRLTIDTKGRVSAVDPSLAVFSSANSYAGGFRAAVETAVVQWRFVPAQIQHVEAAKSNDGHDVIFLRPMGKTDWTLDVAFTFSASGDVVAGIPGMENSAENDRDWRRRMRNFFVRLFGGRVLSHDTR